MYRSQRETKSNYCIEGLKIRILNHGGTHIFMEFDRPANHRRWVSNGLNAYNVVVNELSMCLRGDDVCEWVSNVKWMKRVGLR